MRPVSRPMRSHDPMLSENVEKTTHQQPAQPATSLLKQTSNASNVGVAPHLLLLPPDLRLNIYELVFTTLLNDNFEQRKSSHTLTPLLICRQVYVEARLLAFAVTTHYLNLSRSSVVHFRLQSLPADQVAHIRHIAINSTAGLFHNEIHSIRRHVDHERRPFMNLDSLTIILDLNHFLNTPPDRRLKELNMMLNAVYYCKNVRKITIVNMIHRDLVNETGNLGRWILLDDGKEDNIEGGRWRFELTTFYNYGQFPWSF